MDQERLGDDHLILKGGGGLALFGNKYSDPKSSSQATVFESVFYSLHMEGVEDGLKYRGLRRWPQIRWK